MVSEVKSDRERQTRYNLNYTWNLRKLKSQKQSSKVVVRGWGVGEMRY